MSELLCSELKRWRTLLRRVWLAKGFNEIPKWVFPNQAGKMLDMDNLKSRQYKRLLKKAKLCYIPFHCLRDTFATLLLMSNVPLTYISEQLGHKDPSVTEEHYVRWLPGSNREAMDVLPGPDLEIIKRSDQRIARFRSLERNAVNRRDCKFSGFLRNRAAILSSGNEKGRSHGLPPTDYA